MRRNRRQATGLVVSLFPFLAVLICTMGVLIVMLVMAVQSSSVKAQAAKQEHALNVGQTRDVLLDQLDLEQFRVEKITEMRPEIQRRLEKEKLQRSHLDDEIRKLIQESSDLTMRFERMKSDESLATESRDSEFAKIGLLKKQIEDRRKQLQDLRNTVADRPVLYSIVPTRSAQGAGRRPIYVECQPSGIVLQPSGIRISLDDFTKPILPGNPLDVALLATREYWNKFDAGSSEGEPYPLIVVRPGGATAYAVVRRAMTSWDDEFGYELVESEKKLNWGTSDPNLAHALRQAISIALQRQRRNVAAGRTQWMNNSSDRTAATMGGQPLAGGANSDGDATHQPGSRYGNSTERSTSGRDSSDFQSDHSHNSEFAGSRSQSSRSPGIDTSKNDALSRFASEGRKNLGQSGGRGSGDQDHSNHSDDLAHRPNGTANGRANDQSNKNNGQRSNARGDSAGQTQGDPAALSANVQQTEPLAGKRGAGWALPTRTPGATPYRRPIRVDCNESYYLVHASDIGRDPVRVEINQSVDFAIDELVNQVWNQIEGWGIAEIGGYWKPVLRLSTGDIQGASRADELARKMEGSGIEIERQWR